MSAWSIPLLAAWSAVFAGFVATVALRSRPRVQPLAPLAPTRVLLVRPCTLAAPSTIAAMATVPRLLETANSLTTGGFCGMAGKPVVAVKPPPWSTNGMLPD